MPRRVRRHPLAMDAERKAGHRINVLLITKVTHEVLRDDFDLVMSLVCT